MDVSALKKDKYLVNLDSKAGSITCSDADGNILFGISQKSDPSAPIQFLGAGGKLIAQIKQSQTTPYMEIYDDSGKMIGYAGMHWQLGAAILNDPENNSIAVGISEGDFKNFKVAKTDGKTIIATINLSMTDQAKGQAIITVQEQFLQPLLLLGFIFAVPRLLPKDHTQHGAGGGGGLLSLWFAGGMIWRGGGMPGLRGFGGI